MPAVIKFTAPAAGEHEVPIPDDYLHKDSLKDEYVPKAQFQEELGRRVAAVTKDHKKPEELINDDTFVATLLSKRKDNVIKMLGLPEPGQIPDVGKVRNEVTEAVRRDEVEPLAKQMKVATEEIGSLRIRDLKGQVSNSGVKLRVVPDLMDLVSIHVQQLVDWDPDHRQWFAKRTDGKEGFQYSTDPKAGGYPYKTVPELMLDLSRDPTKKAWFETTTQEGAGYKGGGGNGRDVTVESYQKMSSSDQTAFATEHPEEFSAIMQQIQTAGEAKLFARR